MKILLASHNQGKIKRYQRLFSDIKNLKLVTLNDLEIDFKADEPFTSPQENSVHKAQVYGNLSQLPTIAIDEAVSTNFLPQNEQPGVFVRRFKNKKELSDEEVLVIWQEVFNLYPKANHQFIWDFSLSFFNPKNNYLQTVSAQQIDNVSLQFSTRINPGYPMSSFLIPEGWQNAYVDLSESELLVVDKKNLHAFIELVNSIVK